MQKLVYHHELPCEPLSQYNMGLSLSLSPDLNPSQEEGMDRQEERWCCSQDVLIIEVCS